MRMKQLPSIYIFLLVLIYLFITTSAAFAQESNFALIPDKSQVKVREKVNIAIQAKNIKNVYAYELVINYDSSKLKLEEVRSEFEGYDFIKEVSDNEIKYVFTLVGKDSAELNGDLTLCTMVVSSKNVGNADILLKSIEVSDRQLNSQQFNPNIKAVVEIIKSSTSIGGKTDHKDTEPTKSTEPESTEPESTEPKITFKDIDDYPWAKEAIEFLVSKGIIQGTSPTTYSPAEPIKRADFILLLVRAFGFSSNFDNNFADVPPSSYYYEALGTAKAIGLAQGVGSNTFNPESPISRQDLMVLICRAMRIAGKNLADGTEVDLDTFKDKHKLSSYAIESVATLVKNGIVVGDGDFINPLSNATRAETAVLIYRIYNYNN